MSDDNRERANGPYKHGKRWRVGIYQGDGPPRYRYWPECEYAKARAYVDSFRDATNHQTIGQAVEMYLAELATVGGTRKRAPLRPSSLASTGFRLRAFFALPANDRPLAVVTEAYCRTLYGARVKAVKPSTHRGELIAAGMFLEWCRTRKYVSVNGAIGVRAQGERSIGKATLKHDDARRFLSAALGEGTQEGLACALLLVLGLRASELVDRVADDVNIEPVLLNVPRGKSRAAKRLLEVPAPLSERLVRHVSGLSRTDRLFGLSRYALHYHVKRLCKVAGVPEVCPHGLRGSACTNIVSSSMGALMTPAQAVERARAQAGHENSGITVSTYIAPGTIESAEAAHKARLLTGNELGSTPATEIPTTTATGGEWLN